MRELFVFVVLFSTLVFTTKSASSSPTAHRLQPRRVTFVLGGPAAGKSTQCSRLVSEFGCLHLSAGDLLREERARKSDTAALIEDYIVRGAIVPVEVTLTLIRNAMEKSSSNRFLIDGFPRSSDNLDGWAASMTSAVVDAVIVLECPDAECERRILERAKSSGRSDDNVQTLQKRFATYRTVTIPVITKFEAEASLGRARAYRIAGDRAADSVYRDVKRAYEDTVRSELLELSRTLLLAEDAGDSGAVGALVSSHCTALGPPAPPKNPASSQHRLSTMARPHVRLMGKSAVVTYVRLVQEKGGEGGAVSVSSCEETRVWQLDEARGGLWTCVHMHRR